MNEEYDFVNIGQLVSQLHTRKNPTCEWLCPHTTKPNLTETFDDTQDLRHQLEEIINEQA
jgi:hypothetical protein